MAGPTFAPDERQPPYSIQTITRRENLPIQLSDPDLSAVCPNNMKCPQRHETSSCEKPQFFGFSAHDYSLDAELTANGRRRLRPLIFLRASKPGGPQSLLIM
jgi:hypothetical protein